MKNELLALFNDRPHAKVEIGYDVASRAIVMSVIDNGYQQRRCIGNSMMASGYDPLGVELTAMVHKLPKQMEQIQ